MATFSAPISQAGTVSTWGRSFQYIGDALELELAERSDFLGLGVFGNVYDVAGTGALTLRKRYAGGFGAALTMTAMASETEAITPSGITGNYDDLTVARYGLAHEETWQHAMANEGEVTLQDLAAAIAGSWTSTIRRLHCVSGAAISTAIVDSGSAATITNLLTLVAAFAETEGYQGGATLILHPEQVTDLRGSLRSETASQADLANLTSSQTLGVEGQPLVSASFMGLRILQSWDVQTASSKHQGYAFAPGAFALGIGTPNLAVVPAGLDPVLMPGMGMILTRSGVGAQAFSSVDANAWVGVGRRAVAIAPQFRFATVND